MRILQSPKQRNRLRAMNALVVFPVKRLGRLGVILGPLLLVSIVLVGRVHVRLMMQQIKRSAAQPKPVSAPASQLAHDSGGRLMRREDFPPDPPSLYTKRTGQELPSWAQKFFFLPRPNKTAGDKTICFVHVGKTAGTTLACYLGFQYDCGEKMFFPKGHLRDKTAHLIHNWINDCSEDDDYYLYALRDPVARIKSWFTYERPDPDEWHSELFFLKKPLFLDCPFRTFGDLVEKGLGDPGLYPDISPTCHRRAFDAIRGYRPFCRHNFYNYQYFRNQTPPDATILAIRTEHLQTDWISAEKHLAEQARDFRPINVSFPHRNQSRNVTNKDKDISPKGMKQLCRVLCPEIKVYMELLDRAINLSPEQVHESLNLLRMSCPEHVNVASCHYFPFEKAHAK